jgi:hypothetical protein
MKEIIRIIDEIKEEQQRKLDPLGLPPDALPRLIFIRLFIAIHYYQSALDNALLLLSSNSSIQSWQ